MRVDVRRLAVGLVVVGGVLAVGIVLVNRLRYPIDTALVEKVETVAPFVRKFFDANGVCPPFEPVEAHSVKATGEGLCPGGGVPDHVCIGYIVPPAKFGDCILRYSAGFDEYHSYFVVRDRWYDPTEFEDALVEFHQAIGEKGRPEATGDSHGATPNQTHTVPEPTP